MRTHDYTNRPPLKAARTPGPAGLVTWLALSAVLACGCSKSRPPSAARPREFTTKKTNIRMIVIPAGEFTMGGDGADDERPARAVRISGFCMDKHEVTQREYQDLMGTNTAKFPGPDRPVEQLSWHAAIRYCNARSLADGLTPCYDERTGRCDFDADGYRLPTEAEWEYACRAGTSTDYSFGGGPHRLRRHAWFKANSRKATHPVGTRQPNPWGLHDMHGNVLEWCNDFYADSYAPAATDNPRGPGKGAERVLRGGSWRSSADACRSAARTGEAPGFADKCFGYEAYGFRCVRKSPPAGPAREGAR